jgi:FkbM family methyltransferase
VSGLARSRLAYRVGASQVVGYPLILGWDKGWLPRPTGEATAVLKDGRQLRCLLADRTQRTMYLGLFEPSETRLFRRLLAPGDTVLDVGAHIGWFTTIAAHCVGSAGEVVAFEPYPPNASMLKENLARNRCTNVRVVETALGSRPGTLALARGRGDSGGVTALDWAHDRPAVVPVTTLDEVTAGLEAVTLAKIDVEGWEPHVLRGAAKTLSRTRYVLIEINRPALAKAGSSPEELFGLLRSSGFVRFMTIAEVGLRRLHRSLVCNVLATRADQD